jgi:hypothetical protein
LFPCLEKQGGGIRKILYPFGPINPHRNVGVFYYTQIFINNNIVFINMNIKKIILEEIKLSIFEGIEHMQNLYKSWANKKSGNPEAAMKIMDDVISNRRNLPKKDFASYNSYEELVKDLNKIKQDAKSEDASKLYEDKDLLVVAANTWEASCKYGAGSKWCTTARDTDSYWKRHNETGTEFFWIFKNKPQDDPNHKFSFHIQVWGGYDWCNAINNCRSELPENSYPKKHPMYDQIISKLQEFHDQRNLTKNYSHTRLRLFSISDWVEDNIKYLISCFGVERYIDTNFDESLNNFVEYEMFEKVPLNGDIDDKYYMKQFYADMIEYLDENTLNSYSEDDFIQNSMIVPNIAHLINAYPEIFEPILNNTATPEEVCEKLTDFEFEDELTEILNETTLTYCSDLIDKQSSNFALKY